MSVTVQSFRADFPRVFGSKSVYPDQSIIYWLMIANLLMSPNQCRWGVPSATADTPPTTVYDMATELFVAHNLVLEKQATDAASKGGNPGITKGPVASYSVGGVSVSYSTDALIEPDAGHWNLTLYGIRFIKLARFYGSGPFQIGTGHPPPFALLAWAGPITALGPDDWDQ